jgi:uncharacterized protein YcbX
VRIVRIGFTPLKGGRHLSHDVAELALTGPVGDRSFCLVDPARRRVLRTVENPRLLQTVSHWRHGVLSVALPAMGPVVGSPAGTGSMLDVDYWGRVARVEVVEGPWAAACSRFLGHEVVLARPVTPSAVVYGAPVSLVTTQAMRWLSERVGRELEPERFRPTFVIGSGAGHGRPEETWQGRELRIGEARVLVRAAMPRCAVLDLHPGTGRRDARVLQALAESRAGGSTVEFGVDAVVTCPGNVRVRDRVECGPARRAEASPATSPGAQW